MRKCFNIINTIIFEVIHFLNFCVIDSFIFKYIYEIKNVSYS